jgi:hypothetical protein
MAIAIAGGKIHPAIDAARILAQRLFDDAHGLDELAPVQRAEQPQTADAVADRDLIGSLLLVLPLDQVLDRQPDSERRCSIQVSGKASAGPRPCRRRASSATKAPTIGGFERAMSAITRIRLLGSLLGGLRHPVGPGIGQVSLVPGGGDAHADAAQILDQGQPQHDRNRPTTRPA